ncbi:hypothetical protein LJC58_06135 [Lachnospiraceae bacterium OttesenSCG-928-D06]|nr:hypothetical protein [Lachnospiraceae bacterium OttesenSCG-928-D06]
MYNREKEIREAIDAGNRALYSLEAAKNDLSSAKALGIWDMFGGGFISGMMKRSKMNDAQEHMEQAKYNLQNFSRELQDVNMACNLHIEVGDFLSFADVFFDGLVVDWLVQNRIKKSKEQVEEAIRHVHRIMDQLGRI